jgi:hypothetical protein
MRSNRRTTIAAVLVVLGGAWLCAPPDHAMNTKPMNLADLVHESNQIVVGNVSAVNQGIGANHLPYTDVEVRVSESILGASGATLTFRQFGLQSAIPASDGRRYAGLVAGMPHYKVGDYVVLFLSKTSSIGYRSTIGLGQGKFELRGGNLENGVNNAGLFQNLNLGRKRLDDKEKHLVTTTQGAVGADAFLGFLRRAVREKWWNAPTRKPPAASQPGSALPPGVAVGRGSAHE